MKTLKRLISASKPKRMFGNGKDELEQSFGNGGDKILFGKTRAGFGTEHFQRRRQISVTTNCSGKSSPSAAEHPHKPKTRSLPRQGAQKSCTSNSRRDRAAFSPGTKPPFAAVPRAGGVLPQPHCPPHKTVTVEAAPRGRDCSLGRSHPTRPLQPASSTPAHKHHSSFSNRNAAPKGQSSSCRVRQDTAAKQERLMKVQHVTCALELSSTEWEK